jgi:hypothetical protein
MTGLPFDDADVEDAWDASDPVPVCLDNIVLRLIYLLDLARPSDPQRPGRIDRLFDDLATIRERIAAGDG